MTVGYNKTFGVIMLFLGITALVLGIVAGGRGISRIAPYISGGCCVLVGILYLTRTYFTLGADCIEVKALLGPLRRTWEFDELKDVVQRDGKIYVIQGGQLVKVSISRWLADGREWQAFLKALSS